MHNLKRILLKISGEALSGETKFGVEFSKLQNLVSQIKKIVKKKIQLGVVIGGGNFLRGMHIEKDGFSRVNADYMGMMGTVINALAFSDILSQNDVESEIMSEIHIPKITQIFDNKKALHYLNQNKVLIFCCGTGSPFFTTDSAAALKASEIDADLLLKATKVDGVYDSDPKINKNAKLYKKLSYKEYLDNKLGVMDLTSITICEENKIPIFIFNLLNKNAIYESTINQNSGTLIGG